MKRPNIVFILTDDQGIWTLGCAGNSEIRTPNLDRLATGGMRFDNFFCTSPVCSPARASILTGGIPSWHGIHDYIRREAHELDYLGNRKTYTEFLAEADYRCGLSGKLHLGCSDKPRYGFSHWYVHKFGGGFYYEAPMYRDSEAILESEYITDLITDDAISFIRDSVKNDPDTPFYSSIHYTAPHSPWTDGNHPQEVIDSYKDCPFESCPQEPRHPWALETSLTELCYGKREHLQGYFAAITAMDANVGRILDELDALGIADDTIVYFTSDNGFSCGHHGFWGKGNGTFPMNMYDNSVKVPMIVRHPGLIPEGRIDSSLLSHYDIMPTLLEWAGLDVPDFEYMPGRSFAPVLRGGEQCCDAENVVVYDEYGPVRMIRSQEWKYIHRYPYGPHEFYDLVNDPGERDNLIDEDSYKDVRESMKACLDEWFARYTDPPFDGRHEAVYGAGQINFSGIVSKGKPAFARLI